MTPETQEENTELLQAFALRLGNLAEMKRLTQTDIAEKLGVSLSRVSNWFQGRNYPRRADRPKLAQMLGVTLEFLIHGTTEAGNYTTEKVQEARALLGGDPMRQIPVISWSHAGAAMAYEEMPRHWQGSSPTTSRDPRAFALIVEGDCMEPKYLPGDRVVLEPSRPPVNGKPVVARLTNDEVQLRIYHKMSTGEIKLSSLRPEIYPTETYMPDAFAWIYPVLELIRTA